MNSTPGDTVLRGLLKLIPRVRLISLLESVVTREILVKEKQVSYM